MATVLSELNTAFNEHNLEQQVRALIQLLQQSTGLESTYFTRIDLDKGVQQVVYALNSGKLQLNEGLKVNWDDTLCKRALEQRQFVTTDVASCWGDSAAATELGINTYMSAPVCLSGGEVYGTVCAASTLSASVSAENRTLIELIGRIIGMQVEREQLLQQLEKENRQFRNVALTDPLTGLGNRRALEQELKRALANSQRNGTAVYAAYIDLDNFKTINDEYGHDAGDRFLLAITERLKQGRRDGDFIARIGGDEFVIFGFITGTDVVQAGKVLRQQIYDATEDQFDIGTSVLFYKGASVGLALAQPGDDATLLLKRADEQMYQQKKLRKSKRA